MQVKQRSTDDDIPTLKSTVNALEKELREKEIQHKSSLNYLQQLSKRCELSIVNIPLEL